MRDFLINEKGKYCNILVTGPTDCGKTSLCKSFKNIFLVFGNAAVDKYAWVGAGTAEIILSNDFCWCSEIIEQKDHFAKDLSIAKDSPVLRLKLTKYT